MKTVLITGGGKGIGKALCELFSVKGYNVISLDISHSEPMPGISCYDVDITNSNVLKELLSKLPEIDILINNAGVMRRGNIFESSEKDFDELFAVNVKGSWLLMKYTPLTTNGIIVQISSVHGLDLVSDPGLYSITKVATAKLAELVKLTKSDVTVKIAYPGPIDTDMARKDVTDIAFKEKQKHMISSEDFAKKLLDLVESDAAYLTFDYTSNTYALK